MIEYLERLLLGRDGGLQVRVRDANQDASYQASITHVDTIGLVMTVGDSTRFAPWTAIRNISVDA